MSEKKKENIVEEQLLELAVNPKSAETAEGSYTTHNVKDLIELDEYLARKKAGQNMRAPYGMKSGICVPGKIYG